MRKKKLNKKGIAPIVFVGIGIIVVALIFLIVSKFAFAGVGRATSFEQNQGLQCNDLRVEVGGELVVFDRKFIGIEPAIREVSDLYIRSRPLALEPFNYKVELVDASTGQKLDDFSGRANLDSKEKDVKVPFTLNYVSPDNDCDGVVDDTSLELQINIKETDDVFKNEDTITEPLEVRNGKIV